MAYMSHRAPLMSEPTELTLYRMDLVDALPHGESETQYQGADDRQANVSSLKGVRIVKEVIAPDGECPVGNPGRGAVTVSSDSPPLLMISRLLGYRDRSGGSEQKARDSVTRPRGLRTQKSIFELETADSSVQLPRQTLSEVAKR